MEIDRSRIYSVPGHLFLPPRIPAVPAWLQPMLDQVTIPFEKQLTRSDLGLTTTASNRLVIKCHDVLDILIPMLQNNEDLRDGLEIRVYDADGAAYDMELKAWLTDSGPRSPFMFVLQGQGWTDFAHDQNFLPHEDILTMWSFRHLQTQRLSLIMSSRRIPGLNTLIRVRGLENGW